MAAVRDQQVSISIDDDEIRANVEQDDEVTSKPKGASVFGNAGFRVEPECPEFNIVGRSFLSGLGAARTRAKVVDVYRCGESESVRTRARADAFRIYAEAVARKRGGDANVKQGWYGGSREEIGAIVAHGFSGCNAGAPCNGGAWGRGVHLSAAKHAFDAVMGCEEDEAGMRHILMCRLILGNQEEIRPGSDQCYPSSMEFDSGVDCLTDPKKYLVWSAYMNVYILPSYIVSFKIDDSLKQGELHYSYIAVLLALAVYDYVSYSEFERVCQIVPGQIIRRVKPSTIDCVFEVDIRLSASRLALLREGSSIYL
uniref:PARP catalytic domain-containing protein n=1 Tax=Kalanchoe fedtschenkoi TaxID=63787 RepID=A0A7N0VJE3_KALFE